MKLRSMGTADEIETRARTVPMVNCSDLYPAFMNDYLVYVLQARHGDDPEKKRLFREKMDRLTASSRQEKNLFYMEMACHLRDAIKCRCLGYRNEPLALETARFFFQLRIVNPARRVYGSVDALCHRDVLLDRYGYEAPPGKDFVFVFVSDKRPSAYKQTAVRAATEFLSVDPRIENGYALVTYREDGARRFQVVETDPESAETIRGMIRRVRFAFRLAEDMELGKEIHPIFYPNMKNRDIWMPEKKAVNETIGGDITSLWGCDDRHRQRAFRQRIWSWKDPRLTPEILGFVDRGKREILSRILETNRGGDNDWIRVPDGFLDAWDELRDKTPADCADMVFLDFEYTREFTYLVGVVHNNEYTALWADSLDREAEHRLLTATAGFLRGLPANATVWYWHAEAGKWRSLCDRHKTIPRLHTGWHDLCHLMRGSGITMRGALDYSLKSVAAALVVNDRLDEGYAGLECQDGEASIAIAEAFYKNRDAELYRVLETYNRMDCVVMQRALEEILSAAAGSTNKN